jgi:phosphoenolpyruvate synthase/pyruvate phosphate dikinase
MSTNQDEVHSAGLSTQENAEDVDYKKIAFFLYNLLDDIDTISDIVKDNNVLYRSLVEQMQDHKKHVVQSCDGHTLVLKNPSAPFDKISLIPRDSQTKEPNHD